MRKKVGIQRAWAQSGKIWASESCIGHLYALLSAGVMLDENGFSGFRFPDNLPRFVVDGCSPGKVTLGYIGLQVGYK